MYLSLPFLVYYLRNSSPFLKQLGKGRSELFLNLAITWAILISLINIKFSKL